MNEDTSRNGEDKSAEDCALPLTALTAKYDAKQHKFYVDQLLEALTRRDVHRIALAAHYGAGKSSILQGLLTHPDFKALRLRAVTVSLSTLEPGPDTPRAGDREPSVGGVETALGTTKTNLIQKEIVKQLLHVRPPSKTPLSRYRRLSHPRGIRALWLPTLVAGLVAAGVAMSVLGLLGAGEPWARVIATGLIASVLVGAYLTKVRGRLSLSELKAGSTAGSLALTSHATWFDEYLDEIIYLFDSSNCRLVIFEDIDRFDDPQIFEALRDLNRPFTDEHG